MIKSIYQQSILTHYSPYGARMQGGSLLGVLVTKLCAKLGTRRLGCCYASFLWEPSFAFEALKGE